jgi:tRNA-splicing ligase RtcB
MPFKRDNVLVWASDLEENTLQQAAAASRLPFIAGHLALMPDAHIGKGATVGSVIPTKGAIIPAAVGVDIGCGMIASKTVLRASDLPDSLDSLMPLIEQRIPAGVGKGHPQTRDYVFYNQKSLVGGPVNGTSLTSAQTNTAVTQFGTLGSGNHFVEVCLDENDDVWIVLHSGSRGIGNQLASWHINEAKGLMKQLFIKLEDPDLAYFVENTPQFQAYIADLLWAQNYALGNREAMMDEALEALSSIVGRLGFNIEESRINCHHNYTAQENHNGQNVWLTRKGAIRARTGDLGIIPGSMGTRSYIVEGLGNPASYNSCSHGAGRRFSRGQAKRELDLDTFIASMEGKTWNSDRAASLLDESSLAYKNIDQVMEDQKDLVRIVHTLSQVFNYKG